jgi:RNA polymerase sigma-70 factor, ECF subfamily
MAETPVSLLERLRLEPDDQAWQQLVDLYTPLIRGWLRRYSLQDQDADDLVQDILTVVVQKLPQFEHDRRQGAFRHWLRSIAVNRLRLFWRSGSARAALGGKAGLAESLDLLEDPTSELSRAWNQEHDRYVTERLLKLIEPQFEPATWNAFRLQVSEGRKAAEAAGALGISVNAALIAKSRVLARLRREGEGLID